MQSLAYDATNIGIYQIWDRGDKINYKSIINLLN